jgi:UDP:flavonoid glycosyltransferase YjiC (YdhE family)
VSLPQALAQADLCVCHAGEATLAQSLLAGVPLLMLPRTPSSS